ncbi:MAG: hypothetical protein AAF716_00440 [Cyanobacteria bacterium P01_D01_bin.1]
MSETVLPQLQAVISDLEAEESNLTAQLTAIQTRKDAVLSVIDMFEGSDETSSSANTAVAESSKTAKESSSEASEPSSEPKPAATATKTKTKTKTKGKAKKKDGRTADWQKYTLPGVGDQPMPEAVKLILATKPKEDFKIAEVMSGLFKEDMPKNQYLKARNRISNILSGGVRDGEWFKGARGAYRLTEG